MENLTLKDIVALATAGYKKKDVMELIEASKAIQEPTVDNTEPERSNNMESDITVANTPDKVSETVTKEITQPDATEDFKAKYEAEKARADSLQNKLIRQDVSGSVTEPEVDLVALVRDFC